MIPITFAKYEKSLPSKIFEDLMLFQIANCKWQKLQIFQKRRKSNIKNCDWFSPAKPTLHSVECCASEH